MPTLNQVRNAVDAQLADLWTIITARQALYLAAHGRYWQGKRTMSYDLAYSAAADGTALADRLNDKPTDIVETWLDLFPALASTPLKAVFWIDAYSGPLGQGYVGHVLVLYDGVIYSRSRNEGPETWHTAAWRVVNVSNAQAMLAGK